LIFQTSFFGWGGEDGVIPPLSKGGFFIRIGIGEFFGGWGLTQKVIFWVAWEGEVWLIFKAWSCNFFNFPRNYSFGGVGWGVWRKRMGMFFFLWYGDLMKIFSQENTLWKLIFFWANGKFSTQKFHFKNLTKRKIFILSKIEHLIHLTKKENLIIFDFLCV
jgi:hypothetical protein